MATSSGDGRGDYWQIGTGAQQQPKRQLRSGKWGWHLAGTARGVADVPAHAHAHAHAATHTRHPGATRVAGAPGEARLAHARDRDFARRRRRRARARCPGGRAAARDARVAAGLAFRSSWVDGPGGDVDADRGVGW